jgi:hypothetical protein
VLGQKFRSAACETRFAASSKQVVQLLFGLRYQKRRTLFAQAHFAPTMVTELGATPEICTYVHIPSVGRGLQVPFFAPQITQKTPSKVYQNWALEGRTGSRRRCELDTKCRSRR